MSTTIYYFSATGNSLKVTKDLSEQLTDTEIVQISKKSIPTSKDTQSNKKILNKKDIKLAASFCVFMPGSDQLMFPTVSDEAQNKLFKDEKEQINTIALAIKSNQHVKYKSNAIMSSTNKL